jgi:hypothetical protein
MVVSERGIAVNPAKVSAMLEWLMPRCVTEVRNLGMVCIGYVDTLMALLFVSGEDDLAAFRCVFSDIKIPANLTAGNKPS